MHVTITMDQPTEWEGTYDPEEDVTTVRCTSGIMPELVLPGKASYETIDLTLPRHVRNFLSEKAAIAFTHVESGVVIDVSFVTSHSGPY